jgi:hypothetical protein
MGRPWADAFLDPRLRKDVSTTATMPNKIRQSMEDDAASVLFVEVRDAGGRDITSTKERPSGNDSLFGITGEVRKRSLITSDPLRTFDPPRERFDRTDH